MTNEPDAIPTADEREAERSKFRLRAAAARYAAGDEQAAEDPALAPTAAAELLRIVDREFELLQGVLAAAEPAVVSAAVLALAKSSGVDGDVVARAKTRHTERASALHKAKGILPGTQQDDLAGLLRVYAQLAEVAAGSAPEASDAPADFVPRRIR